MLGMDYLIYTANVGINDVIETAGVARMTLYTNFSSKEELTVAVYEQLATNTLLLIDAAGEDQYAEAERIASIVDVFAMGMNSPEYRGCPFIHASFQESRPAGPILSLVRTYKTALRNRIWRALSDDRPNRGEVADQIVLLLDGAVTEAYIGGVPRPLQKAKRAVAVLLAAKP
jgi:AcrR family transcriptional regulator